MIDERFVKWSMILVENGKSSPSLSSFYSGSTKGLLFYKTRDLASNAASRRNEQLAGTKSTSRFKIIKCHDADSQKKHYDKLKADQMRKDARRRLRIGY